MGLAWPVWLSAAIAGKTLGSARAATNIIKGIIYAVDGVQGHQYEPGRTTPAPGAAQAMQYARAGVVVAPPAIAVAGLNFGLMMSCDWRGATR
jgi:hypothetical protein